MCYSVRTDRPLETRVEEHFNRCGSDGHRYGLYARPVIRYTTLCNQLVATYLCEFQSIIRYENSTEQLENLAVYLAIRLAHDSEGQQIQT